MFALAVTLLLIVQANAQSTPCDYSQAVQPSRTYYIYSPNYPDSYPRNAQCRWIASCPSGYRCRAECNLNMAATSGCSGDRVLFSRSGDTQLINAERYCGRQTISIVSTNQTLVVGFISTSTSSGGNFICELTAQLIPPTQSTCICGIRKTSRIVGGTDAGVNEFTMMAAIIELSVRLLLCGGTILTEQHILTAAHCLENQRPAGVEVRLGDRNITRGIRFGVSGFIIHPQFNSESLDYDIAVLLLASRITFNDNIRPVCLPFNQRNQGVDGLAGTYVILLGGGGWSCNL